MSLNKRGQTWWIDFVTPHGRRVRRSAQTGNQAEAQEVHDRLKSEVWRIQKLDPLPRSSTLNSAVKGDIAPHPVS
jgi:hypothetical protein